MIVRLSVAACSRLRVAQQDTASERIKKIERLRFAKAVRYHSSALISFPSSVFERPLLQLESSFVASQRLRLPCWGRRSRSIALRK